MSININKKLKNKKGNRLFANKSFADFRNELLQHANLYFNNVNTDFSETSLGGMFLDFASLVGESTSFYIDQQLNEINYETAVLDSSIQKHLRRAGINTGFSSSSSVKVSFFIEVNVDFSNSNTSEYTPEKEYLPIIKKGTTLKSESGIDFILEEDINFNFGYEINFGEVDNNGDPLTLILSKEGTCSSGNITEEVFLMPDEDDNFLSITLEQENITEIISVYDEDSNEYYKVEYLTQDTVYKSTETNANEILEVKLAPYRFIEEKDNVSLLTTLRFGNGDNRSLKDDVLVNLEDFSLPIRGKNYIERFSLDPSKLLNNNTLGVSPKGKTLIIKYRYGGGLSHNVPEETINDINNLLITFPNVDSTNSANEIEIASIRDSISIINFEDAVGGSEPISLQELKSQIPNFLKMQSRIVSKEDLLARIYTMPNNFGKIHKVFVKNNESFKGSTDIFILTKDNNNKLLQAPDSLKLNLIAHIFHLHVFLLLTPNLDLCFLILE